MANSWYSAGAIFLIPIAFACSDDEPLSNSNQATPDAGVENDGGDEVVDAGYGGMDAASPADAGTPDSGIELGDAGTSSLTLAIIDLIPDTVQATCSALYRCCNVNDQIAYFAQMANSVRLMDEFAPRLPPQVMLDEAGCRTVLTEIFVQEPWGPWVTAVTEGVVEYDPEAAGRCLDRLLNASCGDSVSQALYDSTCLGFNPPSGGDRQRKMFRRTAPPEAACNTLTDGVGGALYGTCDPTVGFCCLTLDTDPDRCRVGVGEGTCTPASQAGEGCGFFPTLRICATGLACGVDSCVAEPTTPLNEGDACYDEVNGVSLGRCVDSFCDSLASNVCVPLRPLGQECGGAFECASGACAGTPLVCVEDTFCTTTSTIGN